jgi:transposase InsO family protein
MDLHSGARTCPASRALLATRVREQRWTVSAAARAAGISRVTAHKWVERSRGSEADLRDRSSRPHRSPTRTPWMWEDMVVLLRRTGMTGPKIAWDLKLPRATVARILERHGLQRLRDLEPVVRPERYEHRRPGDLVHLDVKKLGRIERVGHRIHGDRTARVRGAGWEYVHVAVDDRTRVAYVELHRDETAATTAGFLRRALAWYRTVGVRVRRILTDNGSGYLGRLFAQACAELSVRHGRTRPYRPRTNGKAERFIQTMLREWAYAVAYTHSRIRARALPRWLTHYNKRRPHSSLAGVVPFSRLPTRCKQRA